MPTGSDPTVTFATTVLVLSDMTETVPSFVAALPLHTNISPLPES